MKELDLNGMPEGLTEWMRKQRPITISCHSDGRITYELTSKTIIALHIVGEYLEQDDEGTVTFDEGRFYGDAFTKVLGWMTENKTDASDELGDEDFDYDREKD